MMDDQWRRVLDVLEAEGPELPIAVLARRLGMPPTQLVPLLDDLFDAGRVTTGHERAYVSLVKRSLDGDGRFPRPHAADASRLP